MVAHFLDFEKPIIELESKIEELKHISSQDINIVDEVTHLQQKVDRLLKQTYSNLSAWQKVQVARHPERPKFLDYIPSLVEGFMPLAGDRLFAEDAAIIGGLGKMGGRTVVVMGHQKGHDTETRIKHNFGMPRPEGYRKAQRLVKLADQFDLPIITFVDTAGAYPGIEAEERGQAEAIARCIDVFLSARVPIVSIVIGEGGSGGAIAIAAANTVLMLEHSVYSVISPEGCASILWRSASKAYEAAEAQKLTAQHLFKLGVIDYIIGEPIGGAHRHKKQMIADVVRAISQSLGDLDGHSSDSIKTHRRDKFLAMGQKTL